MIIEGKNKLVEGTNSKTGLEKVTQLISVIMTPKELIAAKAAIGVLENGLKALANNASNNLPYFY